MDRFYRVHVDLARDDLLQILQHAGKLNADGVALSGRGTFEPFTLIFRGWALKTKRRKDRLEGDLVFREAQIGDEEAGSCYFADFPGVGNAIKQTNVSGIDHCQE